MRRNEPLPHSSFPPIDFSFQLSPEEFTDLKSQGIVTSDGRVALRSQFVTLDTPHLVSKILALKPGRYAKYSPYVFTEHGASIAVNEGGKGDGKMEHSAFME